MKYCLGRGYDLITFLPKYTCKNTARAPTVHLSLGGSSPPAGAYRGAGGEGTGFQISLEGCVTLY